MGVYCGNFPLRGSLKGFLKGDLYSRVLKYWGLTLMIRIGFWGMSYYDYNNNKEPPNSIGNY